MNKTVTAQKKATNTTSPYSTNSLSSSGITHHFSKQNSTSSSSLSFKNKSWSEVTLEREYDYNNLFHEIKFFSC